MDFTSLLHILCMKSVRIFHIRTEFGEIQSNSPHSVRVRENTNQKNFDYGHFSGIDFFSGITINKAFLPNVPFSSSFIKTAENKGQETQ